MKQRSIAALVALVTLLSLAAASPAPAQNRGAARPKVDRPDGPVWQVIRKNCTQCHGIDDYAFYALDKAGWQSLVESKHKSPLAEGVLTGKYNREVAPGTRAADEKLGVFIKDRMTPENIAKVTKLTELAQGLGVPMSNLAIAWCLRRPEVAKNASRSNQHGKKHHGDDQYGGRGRKATSGRTNKASNWNSTFAPNRI